MYCFTSHSLSRVLFVTWQTPYQWDCELYHRVSFSSPTSHLTWNQQLHTQSYLHCSRRIPQVSVWIINYTVGQAIITVTPLVEWLLTSYCHVTDVRPVTPPGEREKRQQQQTMTSSRLPPDTRITVTNLDLLNKLFENIETDKAKGTADNSKTLGSIKRSRSVSSHSMFAICCTSQSLFSVFF